MTKAKVKIVMEANIDDLVSFYPDDPKGASVANVAGLLAKMRNMTLDQISDLFARRAGMDAATFISLKQHYDDDALLALRLMQSLKIELEE